jgi:hypothetical protein
MFCIIPGLSPQLAFVTSAVKCSRRKFPTFQTNTSPTTDQRPPYIRTSDSHVVQSVKSTHCPRSNQTTKTWANTTEKPNQHENTAPSSAAAPQKPPPNPLRSQNPNGAVQATPAKQSQNLTWMALNQFLLPNTSLSLWNSNN